jgi:hypothetical protein
MLFESIDAVKIFASEDHEKAVVPDMARALLRRFDKISQHHEVVISSHR